MSVKKMIYVCLAVFAAAAAYFAWKMTARSSYESAQYTVLSSEGPFEAREYPDLMLASTDMQFQTRGEDGSFMRLFRYISGANVGEQKVAMTTPVFMQREREGEGEEGRMGFVMPQAITEDGIPQPSNGEVKIHKRPGGRFAVITFAGRLDRDSFTKRERELRRWMDEKGLVGEKDAELAGYDPPWTPGPLRRNEILVRLR